MTCPGHRRTAGKLLGVCIGCDAQDNMSRNQPPEIRVAFGAYVCDARRYTPPVDRDGTHRFAVPVVAE